MRQKVLILFFTQILFFSVFAQEDKLEYAQHLTIADNLSHNGVTDIFEDSRGYLWVSTYDGLNRYDGYDFEVFKNTIDNKIFPSNRIRTISEDALGNLWIGTDDGVSLYNYSESRFVDIYSNKNTSGMIGGPVVRKIIMNKDNDVIVCATQEEGIIFFDKDYSFLKRYTLPSKLAANNNIIFDGFPLDKSNYLFLCTAGVFLFDLTTEKFTMLHEEKMRQHGSIIKINENKLLITLDRGFGIFEYKLNKGKYVFDLLSRHMETRDLRSAELDKLGGLWLGTQIEGIIYVDNIASILNNTPFNEKRYIENKGRLRVSSFNVSDKGGCWVGSFDEGIYRFNLKEKPFKTYNPSLDFGFLSFINNLSSVSVFDSKRIFLSASRGGLILLNTETDKFENLPFTTSMQERRKISSIFTDSEKAVWVQIGNDYQFYRIPKGSNVREKIKIDGFPYDSSGHARTICEDKNGDIWIGCSNNVYKITLDNNRVIQNVENLSDNLFFKNKKLTLIRRIYVDPLYDFVWVGGDIDGLYRVELTKGTSLGNAVVDQFVHDSGNIASISSNFVSSIVRLPNNELWLGTEGGGICKVLNSDKEPEFVSYSEKNGLSNNVVKSLLYDDEYNLWVSTNIGLNRFNTKDFTFRSFRKEDGLPFEDFMYVAGRLENGVMAFSGVNDFCYFNPKDISDNESLPNLILSNFKIHNQLINTKELIHNRVLLDKPLNEYDELILKHDENVFSLELTSLHYATPENHFLRYQLLPLNDTWVEVPSDQRIINYNGLQPGKYELRVMASNSLNEWTQPKVLTIIIKPPFWITGPAFILYILFIAILIYSIMYYILRMNKLKHNLEIEHLEKESAKEVNAAKLRFFSNISHEIKTPLTLISGPINLMSERYKGNTDLNDKLKIVQRQSKKIAQLVDQVHDFQRSDANKLKMNYSVLNFNNLMAELVNDFKFLAGNDNKKLELISCKTTIYVSADIDKIEKILNNLLNNAFKYTREGNKIIVEYWVEEKEVHFSVKDTGKGISTDDLPHIFERFYQSKHKHSAYTGGSGIGLAFSQRLVEMHYGTISAESTLGEGTTISVKLPIVSEAPDVESNEIENHILNVEKSFQESAHVPDKVDTSKIEIGGEFSEAKVFFAEDNTDMRQFVAGVLSNFFQVKDFVNGEELSDALKEEWPDIVLSDVLMPEMNGFELCRRIKKDIKTSHIPVVLLTACTSIDEQIKGLKEGADAYIKKPFNVQHVVTRIETLLRGRKQLRERYQIDFPLSLEKKEGANNDIAFLEKLYELMEENLDNTELDMDKLAKKLYLNRTHFFQKVKALTNETPYELLKMYRLKRAAEMLVQKHLSVNEVYMMTGFKSRSNFSKLFKERYESTPGKYAVDALKKME